MVQSRGQTGHVRGLAPEAADSYITQAVLYTQTELGGVFTRAQLRKYARETFNLSAQKAEGIVFAVCDLPGVTSEVKGVHRLPALALEYARHRMWRLPSGRLGLADAIEFVDMVNASGHRPDDVLPPGLLALYKRCRDGIKHLGVKEVS